MKGRITDTLADTLLWFVANLLCGGTALGGAWVLTEWTVGGGGLTLASALVLAGTISVTWGSWLALGWTESRPIRVAQKGVTLVPGLVLLGAGGLGIYLGIGSLLSWLLLAASSVGTLAAAALLWGRFSRASAQRSLGNVGFGLLVYPPVTAAAAGLVGWLWVWFVTNPPDITSLGLVNFATATVTILAIELATTVLPAVFGVLAHETTSIWHRQR